MMSSLTCWSSFLQTNWFFDFHAKPAALKWGGVRGSRWLLTAIFATFFTTSGSSGSPSPALKSTSELPSLLQYDSCPSDEVESSDRDAPRRRADAVTMA